MRRVSWGLLLVAATGASARDLPVAVDKGWLHAASGTVLMSTIAGQTRTGLSDATNGEFDVTAQYQAADGSVVTSLFLFRPALHDVAIWFDRSRTALETNAVMANMSPATPQPIAFAAPGAVAATSLKQVYGNPSGPIRSTALAMVPVGSWLMGIRMSAPNLSAAQLDARMTQVVASIRWPRFATVSVRPAAPIVPCTNAMTFGSATPIASKLEDMMLDLSLVSQISDRLVGAPSRLAWCRDATDGVHWGVYRTIGQQSPDYTMAIGDAGRVVNVLRSVMGRVRRRGGFAVLLTDVDGSTYSFRPFDKQPAPAQVWTAISEGRPLARAHGNEMVTIHYEAPPAGH